MHFGHLDMSSQFELRAQLFSERLKDAEDVSRYISIFENARCHFTEMAIIFTNNQAVFLLLQGLPQMPEWIILKCMTMTTYRNSVPIASTSSSPAVPKMGFMAVAASLSEEANHIRGELKLNGPGSEYANTIGTGVPDSKANVKMGICMHKSNPKGVACTNPTCAGLPHSLTHDHEHCFQPGGGMEGQGSSTCNKKPTKRDVTAAATTDILAIAPPPSTTDLACTIIEELNDVPWTDSTPTTEDMACIARQSMSTILDSGTTSTLITDRDFFWNFSYNNRVVVKTANHGHLPTMGRSDCMADFTIGGRTCRTRFTNYLHALGAMVNLLSVGYMVERGWSVNFLPDPVRCQLVCQGKSLGEVPMLSKLVFLDLRFVHPEQATPSLLQELSAFAHVPVTWDLWHARMGHPGGDAVKRLPLIAKGINISSPMPLQCCESCIVAKHPRQPYPPSSEPRAAHMLDLIHSDLCGPFPIVTPHGKLHFVIFPDNHTNLLNVQLLASKDQALEAWNIIRAQWENHSGCTVKVFRSDNGGEFVSAAFTKALQDAGIEWQLSAPYAHQQNGKVECTIRTLDGHMLAMLGSASLPVNLWGQAVLMACYLWNQSELSALPAGTTPFELVNGWQPDLSHLRVFSAKCFAQIPTELQMKLGPHSHPAVFVRYTEGTKGYRLHDRNTGAFFVARDVIFDKNMPGLPHSDSDSNSDKPPASPLPVVVYHPPSQLTPPLHPPTPTVLPVRKSSSLQQAMPIRKALLLLGHSF